MKKPLRKYAISLKLEGLHPVFSQFERVDACIHRRLHLSSKGLWRYEVEVFYGREVYKHLMGKDRFEIDSLAGWEAALKGALDLVFLGFGTVVGLCRIDKIGGGPRD